MRRAIPPVLANILLTVASIIAALLVANAIYAHLEPIERREVFLNIGQDKFFQYDPLLGWSQIPGAGGTFWRTEFSTRIDVNTQGMRYHEVGPKKNFRVAVLGDSFTWGYGVEAQERYTDVIEKQLGVEMLNFGVSGYGPVQYYLQLEQVLKYEPDLVIVSFSLINDFVDSIVRYRFTRSGPYGTLETGKLEIKGYPIPDSERVTIVLYSHLGQCALGRLVLWTWNYSSEKSAAENQHALQRRHRDKTFGPETVQKQPDSTAQYAMEVTEALLKATQEKLSAHGTRLLVVAIPSKREIKKQGTFFQLENMARRQGIPLDQSLKSAFDMQDYFTLDGHWNAGGHKKAAALLMPAIAQYRDKAKP